jgi:hypothetical protein
VNARGQGWEFIAVACIDHSASQDYQDSECTG